jgi:hypothetical protein
VVEHTPGFLSDEEATTRLRECIEQIPFALLQWMPGRKLPRLVYRYDTDFILAASIAANGSFETPEGYRHIPVLDVLIQQIESSTGKEIRGVFCNLYRNGNDYTPAHRDSYGCDIFTLSLGVSRTCIFEPTSPFGYRQEYQLNNGDLLFFNQTANGLYKHSIPKDTSTEPRVSLVFFVQ